MYVDIFTSGTRRDSNPWVRTLLIKLISYDLYPFTRSFCTFYIGLLFTRTVVWVNVYLQISQTLVTRDKSYFKLNYYYCITQIHVLI